MTLNMTPDMTPRPIRRKWTMPPGWGGMRAKSSVESHAKIEAGEQTGDVADASPQTSQRSVGYYVSRFIAYLMIFGVVALFVGSRFPIDLGMFLFFTDDEFIVWALGKIGIRLIPDTLGTNFIRFFVWLIGLAVLLWVWSASAPAWLSSWLPSQPPAGSWWWALAAVAAIIAVVDTAATAAVKRLLPWLGIARDSLRWTLADGTIRLLVLGAVIGVMYLLGSASLLPNWFGG